MAEDVDADEAQRWVNEALRNSKELAVLSDAMKYTPAGGHITVTPAPTGLGIGLAVVKRLASLHGGFTEARSAGQGMGAQFLLQLPLHPSGG
jgi:signal transduction histidine kinase